MAGATLVVGAALMVRGLWLAWPGPRPTPVAEVRDAGEAASPGGVAPQFTMPLETEVSPETLSVVETALLERIRNAAVALPSHRLEGSRAEQLARSASAYLRSALGGSADDYLAYVEANGGRQEIDLSVEENAAAFRTFFESATAPYTNRRVSVDAMAVRPRVIRGKNIPQGDFGGRVASTSADKRFPELAELAYSTKFGHVIVGDTYEVLLPVDYVYGEESIVVLLGIWMTWSPESGRWLPSRIVTYAAPGSRAPILHPAL